MYSSFITLRPGRDKLAMSSSVSGNLKWGLLMLLVFLLWPGRVAQSVTYLATDACLTADSGVASSIPVRSHTFVKIDHEMISTVILLPSADSFKKGCCQLQAKYVHELLVNGLFKPAQCC